MKYVIYFLIFISLTVNLCAQWTKCSNGLDGAGTIFTIAVSGKNIYAGSENKGIFLSTNDGDTWTQVNTGLTTYQITSIVIRDSNIFAGGAGVFLSSNYGKNWTQIKTVGGACLAISGSNILAGGRGVFLSTNNGGSWTEVDSGVTNKTVSCLALGDSYILAGTNGNGIFLSTNIGNNWIPVNTGLNPGLKFIDCLAISGNNIIAGQNPGGIFLSSNKGSNWVKKYLTTAFTLCFLVYNNFLIGGEDTGIILSTDNGKSWGWDKGLDNTYVSSLATNGNYIYAGTGGGEIYRTELKKLIILSLDKIDDVIMNQDASVEINIPLIASKTDSLQTTIISDNIALLPPDSLKVTITDTSNFMIITPVKRKSGEANITLIFKSGSDSVFTTFKVTVNKPSEIDDFNLNNTILIFPNPSDNRLSIISNNIAPLGIIEIYTLMGIKVFSIEAQNNRTEIDISSFTAGIYFVKIGDFRQIFVKN